MRHAHKLVAALSAVATSATLAALPLIPSSAAALRAGAPLSATGTCTLANPTGPIVGVVPGTPNWQKKLDHFAAATHFQPKAAMTYVPFGESFDIARACSLAAAGTLDVVQMDPIHTSVASIAKGRHDSYLKRLARQIKAANVPVAYSFGHEMNGHWYKWGYRHIRPSLFIKAWRHIHKVFERVGASNVIWMWTTDHNGTSGSRVVGPVRPWWPGGAYVNWVGIDIYYNTTRETFKSGFAPTVKAIRKFTHDPILLTETAVQPGRYQARQIRNLFASVKSAHLLGFLYYDINGRKRWYIDNRPKAITAFRKGLTSLGLQ